MVKYLGAQTQYAAEIRSQFSLVGDESIMYIDGWVWSGPSMNLGNCVGHEFAKVYVILPRDML